jgi:hypothetical protein
MQAVVLAVDGFTDSFSFYGHALSHGDLLYYYLQLAAGTDPRRPSRGRPRRPRS